MNKTSLLLDNNADFSDFTLAYEFEARKEAYVKERTIFIWEEIDHVVEFAVIRMLERMVQKDVLSDSKRPITLKISSPGGDVYSCFAIMSKILELRELGYDVRCYTYGKCMSAALFITMVCSPNHRYAQKFTSFLLHQLQSYSDGVSSVELSRRTYKDLSNIWDKMRTIIKEHTKITDDILDEITTNDRDYFFDSNRAIELGVVDKIV